MIRPITLVRRRLEDGKMGPWEIPKGVEPEQPYATHVAYWDKLARFHPISEDIAEHRLCDLQPVRTELHLKTAEQAALETKVKEDQMAAFKTERIAAEERQREQAEEALKFVAPRTKLQKVYNDALADRCREGNRLDPHDPDQKEMLDKLEAAINDARKAIAEFDAKASDEVLKAKTIMKPKSKKVPVSAVTSLVVGLLLLLSMQARAVVYVLISPGTNLVPVALYTNNPYVGITNQSIMSVFAMSNATAGAQSITPAGSNIVRTFNGPWIPQQVFTNGGPIAGPSYAAWSNAFPSALSTPNLNNGGYFALDQAGQGAGRYMSMTIAGTYISYTGNTNPLTYTVTLAGAVNPVPVPIPGFGSNAFSGNLALCTNFVYTWSTNYYVMSFQIPSNTVNFCFVTNFDTGAVGFWGLYSDQLNVTNSVNPYGYLTNLYEAVEFKRNL